MSFPVNSGPGTAPLNHLIAVMQRSKVRRLIQAVGVFNCRHIKDSTSWSQHAYRNAGDFFCASADQRRIADNVVEQATEKTKANRGKRLPVAHVIISGHIWTPAEGWHEFTGYHPPTHVHVDMFPQGTGTPKCAQ